MSTEYEFIKAINSTQLIDEMNTALLPLPERIDTVGTTVNIFYIDALTSDQQEILNSVIVNHMANPYYINPDNQIKINTLLSYLNNSDMTIANTARSVIVANIAPKMPIGMIDTINAQIAIRLGG